MTRTSIPAGLPVPNPTTSYWQTPKHALANHRTTEDLPEHVVDYVVIGSGITGTLTSYKLLENAKRENREIDIVMLEARETCSGATGRNGGHCRAGRYDEFSDDLDNYGLEEALRLERLEENTIEAVVALIRKTQIPCDLRRVEGVEMYTDRKHLERLIATVKRREQIDEEIRVPKKIWSEEEVKTLLVPNAKGGISFHGWVLSPYKLICGLLEICLQHNDEERQFNLQTTTPVVEIEKPDPRNRTRWRVITPRGIVTTKNVILATNAYTAALYPPLADFIIPTRGQITALRPGKKIEGNPILEKTIMICTEEMCDYFQTRAEWFSGGGDIILGGGRQAAQNGHGQFNSEQPILDDSTINTKVSRHQAGAFTQHFGEENWGEEGRTIMEWTGIMGYTRDTMPIVGRADHGLFVCAGFHGHGMALVERSSEALVGLIEGRGDEVRKWLPKSFEIERIIGKEG
ncbi:oxidoreductase OrdL 2 [Phlyctema vagabunda]|uniref:Oxidoreductase OrdL 2 n=1 Tax=Phlyctema vagabunda TaxID=108571 RepID=A0ABR4PDH0_9HELO